MQNKQIGQTEQLLVLYPISDSHINLNQDFLNNIHLIEELLKENKELGFIAVHDYKAELFNTKILAFQNKIDKIKTFFKNMNLQYSEEGQHCYELAFQQANEFNWKKDAKKKIIFIIHSMPYSINNPANKLKIDFKHEINMLRNRGIEFQVFFLLPNEKSRPFIEFINPAYKEIYQYRNSAYEIFSFQFNNEEKKYKSENQIINFSNIIQESKISLKEVIEYFNIKNADKDIFISIYNFLKKDNEEGYNNILNKIEYPVIAFNKNNNSIVDLYSEQINSLNIADLLKENELFIKCNNLEKKKLKGSEIIYKPKNLFN